MKVSSLLALFALGLLSVLPISAEAQEGNRSISGTVFDDANGDAVYQEGEVVGDGAKIYLVTDPGGEVVALVEADEFGDYLFENVPFGTYKLIVEFPWNLVVESLPFTLGAGEGPYVYGLPVINALNLPSFSAFKVTSAPPNPANVQGSDVSPIIP